MTKQSLPASPSPVSTKSSDPTPSPTPSDHDSNVMTLRELLAWEPRTKEEWYDLQLWYRQNRVPQRERLKIPPEYRLPRRWPLSGSSETDKLNKSSNKKGTTHE